MVFKRDLEASGQVQEKSTPRGQVQRRRMVRVQQ